MPAVSVPADSAPANPVPAVPAPADSVPVPAGCVDGAISTDGSQCYGFEHDAHEYCSNESITTWIWIRGPAPAWSSSVPTAASITAECAGAMKLNAARTRDVPADVAPVAAALSGAKKLHAARARDVPADVFVPDAALSGANKLHAARARSVPDATIVPVDAALPRAKKALAARGRPVPVAMLVPVAAAKSALPGAKKLAARSRVCLRCSVVPDVPAADVC
jgi:hypothetical protein